MKGHLSTDSKPEKEIPFGRGKGQIKLVTIIFIHTSMYFS